MGEEMHKPEPIRRNGRPVGRNDKCPCGSGKKYKQCHGKSAPQPAQLPVSGRQHEFNRGVRRVQSRATTTPAVGVTFDKVVTDFMDRQRARFQVKFGRGPKQGESLLFEPELSGDRLENAEALRKLGLHPAYAFTYDKLGYLLVPATRHMVTSEQRAAWDAEIITYCQSQRIELPPGYILAKESAVQKILVVPRFAYATAGEFEGFNTDALRYFEALLQPGVCEFRERTKTGPGALEQDPSFKQIIPYVVLRCGDKVFAYTRGAAGGEARLHASRSIGIGGHIDEADCIDPVFRSPHMEPDWRRAYAFALARELEEEVGLKVAEFAQDNGAAMLGLVNDESNQVGSVHLGFVHQITLPSEHVQCREADLQLGAFAPIAELHAKRDEFETWSQIVLDHLLTTLQPGATHAAARDIAGATTGG